MTTCLKKSVVSRTKEGEKKRGKEKKGFDLIETLIAYLPKSTSEEMALLGIMKFMTLSELYER